MTQVEFESNLGQNQKYNLIGPKIYLGPCLGQIVDPCMYKFKKRKKKKEREKEFKTKYDCHLYKLVATLEYFIDSNHERERV